METEPTICLNQEVQMMMMMNIYKYSHEVSIVGSNSFWYGTLPFWFSTLKLKRPDAACLAGSSEMWNEVAWFPVLVVGRRI